MCCDMEITCERQEKNMQRNVNKATITQAKFGSVTHLKSDIFRASQADLTPLPPENDVFKLQMISLV